MNINFYCCITKMTSLKKFLDSSEISKVVEKAEKKIKDFDLEEYDDQISSNVFTESLSPLKERLANAITIIVALLTILIATVIVLNHAILVNDPEVLRRTIPMSVLATILLVYYINSKLKQ